MEYNLGCGNEILIFLIFFVLHNEKFFKLDSLFCIIIYKKFFKDFYSGFLNDKRAFIVLLECISIFFPYFKKMVKLLKIKLKFYRLIFLKKLIEISKFYLFFILMHEPY